MPTFDALGTINPLDLAANPAFLERGSSPSAQSFAQKLDRYATQPLDDAPETQNEKLRAAAGQLVSAAFILPLLDEARGSSMKSDLFGGGFAQDSIRQQLDVKLADRIANSGRFPMTDALVKQFTRTATVQPPEVARFA